MVTNQQKELPDLHQAVLDPGTLNQLFEDIQQLTQVIEVKAKLASQEYALPDDLTLFRAKELLLKRSVGGVQIRYLYEGHQWFDTLLVKEQGIKLTRVNLSNVT